MIGQSVNGNLVFVASLLSQGDSLNFWFETSRDACKVQVFRKHLGFAVEPLSYRIRHFFTGLADYVSYVRARRLGPQPAPKPTLLPPSTTHPASQ